MPYDRDTGRAFFSPVDLAYSESFYGYSARSHSEPETLARYLILLLHSDLFFWHSLVTSSQFGVERDSLLKEDVDRFPLRPVEDLPTSLRAMIEPLSSALLAGRCRWTELDRWASDVYRLDPWDQEVVRDCLEVSLPFSYVEKRAQRPPSDHEVETFSKRLERELSPFVRTARRQVVVRRRPHAAGAPWEVIAIDAPKETSPSSQIHDPTWMEDLFTRADQEGASQILVWQEGRLLLGVLRQYRFWTPSRARLCALEVLQGHLGDLLGDE
jgi:hypothetical protein